jgi:cell division topological specificity factor
MNWLNSLFSRERAGSASVAKSRLKIAISVDRSTLSPELLNSLQEDIVRAVSQRVDIDRNGIRITTERGESGQRRIIADIPIKSVRPKPVE